MRLLHNCLFARQFGQVLNAAAVIYNARIVAFQCGFGRPLWHLSLSTSIPLGAAIRHNTYAPLMGTRTREATSSHFRFGSEVNQ